MIEQSPSRQLRMSRAYLCKIVRVDPILSTAADVAIQDLESVLCSSLLFGSVARHVAFCSHAKLFVCYPVGCLGARHSLRSNLIPPAKPGLTTSPNSLGCPEVEPEILLTTLPFSWHLVFGQATECPDR